VREIRGKTFAEAYGCALNEIMNKPDFVTSPRGMKIREITDAVIHIDDCWSNSFENEVRSIPMKYLKGELLWYFSGRNDLEFIEKYSKFWKKIANEDGTCNSAYGKLIFNEKNEHGLTEWTWAYRSLVDDKDTRQAIIRFNKPKVSYPGVKDFVCTLNAVFNIRDNKLNLSTIMRSNDAVLGTCFDIPFFLYLMQVMRKQLLPSYRDLELGSYTHHAVSLHIYERDFDLVNKMLEKPFIPVELPRIDMPPVYTDGSPFLDISGMTEGKAPISRDKFFEWLWNNN